MGRNQFEYQIPLFDVVERYYGARKTSPTPQVELRCTPPPQAADSSGIPHTAARIGQKHARLV